LCLPRLCPRSPANRRISNFSWGGWPLCRKVPRGRRRTAGHHADLAARSIRTPSAKKIVWKFERESRRPGTGAAALRLTAGSPKPSRNPETSGTAGFVCGPIDSIQPGFGAMSRAKARVGDWPKLPKTTRRANVHHTYARKNFHLFASARPVGVTCPGSRYDLQNSFPAFRRQHRPHLDYLPQLRIRKVCTGFCTALEPSVIFRLQISGPTIHTGNVFATQANGMAARTGKPGYTSNDWFAAGITGSSSLRSCRIWASD
jgi:hypothetical protein